MITGMNFLYKEILLHNTFYWKTWPDAFSDSIFSYNGCISDTKHILRHPLKWVSDQLIIGITVINLIWD